MVPQVCALLLVGEKKYNSIYEVLCVGGAQQSTCFYLPRALVTLAELENFIFKCGYIFCGDV